MNQLYYGDNLQVLREHIAKESVDLIDQQLGKLKQKAAASVQDRHRK